MCPWKYSANLGFSSENNKRRKFTISQNNPQSPRGIQILRKLNNLSHVKQIEHRFEENSTVSCSPPPSSTPPKITLPQPNSTLSKWGAEIYGYCTTIEEQTNKFSAVWCRIACSRLSVGRDERNCGVREKESSEDQVTRQPSVRYNWKFRGGREGADIVTCDRFLQT